MIRFNRTIQYSLGLLAAFFWLTSCTDLKEEANTGYRLSNGKVDLTISVTLPQPETVKASTRAGANWDSDITNMDLLIFDKDAKFMKRIRVESDQLTVAADSVSFKVELDATPERRIIHLVANGHWKLSAPTYENRLNFNDLHAGMTESEAISSLRTLYPLTFMESVVSQSRYSVTDVTPLIMWGRFALDNGITAVAKPLKVNLLRATARIQVQKDAVSNAANQLANFKILDIAVHGAPTHGFLAPADCTGTAITPTVARQAPSGIPDAMSGGGIDPDYLDANDPNSWPTRLYVDGTSKFPFPEKSVFYMYERKNTPSDCMSVIIFGSYTTVDGEEVKGYYKIVLTDGNGTPLDIIRNHRYILTIIGVAGPGYKDRKNAIAASHPSNNLKVEITDEHPDFPFVATDGHNILALSNNAYIAYGYESISPSGDYCVDSYSSWLCDVITPAAPEPGVPHARIEGGAAASFVDPGSLGVSTASYYPYKVLLAHFRSKNAGAETRNITVSNGNTLSALPLSVTWHKKISPPSGEDADSYVLDLVGPADRNWNIRIIKQPYYDSSKQGELVLHPTAGSPGYYPGGSGMVTELSGKYNSHAYLHVLKGRSKRGMVLKTSVIDGKPVVTRIEIIQQN